MIDSRTEMNLCGGMDAEEKLVMSMEIGFLLHCTWTLILSCFQLQGSSSGSLVDFPTFDLLFSYQRSWTNRSQGPNTFPKLYLQQRLPGNSWLLYTSNHILLKKLHRNHRWPTESCMWLPKANVCIRGRNKVLIMTPRYTTWGSYWSLIFFWTAWRLGHLIGKPDCFRT